METFNSSDNVFSELIPNEAGIPNQSEVINGTSSVNQLQGLDRFWKKPV